MSLTATETELVRLFEKTEADILRALNGVLTKPARKRLLSAKREVRSALKGLREGSADWAQKAVAEGYKAGAKAADSQVPGIIAALSANPVHLEAMKALADGIMERTNGVADVVLSKVSRQLADIQSEMLRQQLSGAKTTLQAAREIRNELSKDGATILNTGNRTWKMGDYADMLARTSSQQATIAGTANRLVEHGQDLVTFTTHARPCPICREWEGKVLSLTGATDGYPTLEDAKAGGMLHPRCKHALVAYFD